MNFIMARKRACYRLNASYGCPCIRLRGLRLLAGVLKEVGLLVSIVLTASGLANLNLCVTL
jgi:hypothetical protein